MVAVRRLSGLVVSNRLQPPIEFVITQGKAIELDVIHDVGEQSAAVVVAFKGALEHIPRIDEDGVLLILLLLEIGAKDFDSREIAVLVDLAVVIVDGIKI